MLVVSFLYIVGYFWFIILVCLIFAIIPPSIESSPLGSPSLVYRPFPGSRTPFLRGKLEFLADAPSEFIALFRPGSSRAAPLGLNNLFLVSLFAGSVCSVPHLFANKVAAFQPPYSAALLVEDLRPDCVASSLCSAVLSRSFAPLPGSPSIRGPTPSYGPTPEVAWSPGSNLLYNPNNNI